MLDAAALAQHIPLDLALEAALPAMFVQAGRGSTGRQLEMLSDEDAALASGIHLGGQLNEGHLRMAAYRLLQAAGELSAPAARINETRALA